MENLAIFEKVLGNDHEKSTYPNILLAAYWRFRRAEMGEIQQVFASILMAARHLHS